MANRLAKAAQADVRDVDQCPALPPNLSGVRGHETRAIFILRKNHVFGVSVTKLHILLSPTGANGWAFFSLRFLFPSTHSGSLFPLIPRHSFPSANLSFSLGYLLPVCLLIGPIRPTNTCVVYQRSYAETRAAEVGWNPETDAG